MEVVIFPGPHCSLPNNLRAFATANAEALASRGVFVPPLKRLAAAMREMGPYTLSPEEVGRFAVDELDAPEVPNRLVLLNEYVWSDLKWAWAPERTGSDHHTFYPNAVTKTRKAAQAFSQVDVTIVSAVEQPSSVFGRICEGGWSDASPAHVAALPYFSWADFHEDLWAALPEANHTLIVQEGSAVKSDVLMHEVFDIPPTMSVNKRYAYLRSLLDRKGRRKLDRAMEAQHTSQVFSTDELTALFEKHKRLPDEGDAGSRLPLGTLARVEQNYLQDLAYLAEEAASHPSVLFVGL